MKFEQVLPALREGKKARRLQKTAALSVLTIRDGKLVRIYAEQYGGSEYILTTISAASVVADDWEVIE